MANVETRIVSVSDLMKSQRDFQTMIGNDLPNGVVSFQNVQESLAQNLYQTVEFQEFMEADEKERKEELIDYLLFLINKYIFLGVHPFLDEEDGLFPMLWAKNCDSSFCQCDSLARIEQNNYITLIRRHAVFKPWKASDMKEDCVSREEAQRTFRDALAIFKQMANIVYHSYYDFYSHLTAKVQINIDRQNNGY